MLLPGVVEYSSSNEIRSNNWALVALFSVSSFELTDKVSGVEVICSSDASKEFWRDLSAVSIIEFVMVPRCEESDMLELITFMGTEVGGIVVSCKFESVEDDTIVAEAFVGNVERWRRLGIVGVVDLRKRELGVAVISSNRMEVSSKVRFGMGK